MIIAHSSAIVFTCLATADYDIGDCIELTRVKISIGQGVSDDWRCDVVEDGDQFYVIDDGKGVAGDVDNCGNDMEGVPYIVVSADRRRQPQSPGTTQRCG